jgi:hypothetical protein
MTCSSLTGDVEQARFPEPLLDLVLHRVTPCRRGSARPGRSRRTRPGVDWEVELIAITAFICHVGYEVTSGVVYRLADGVDPSVITTAEAAAGSVPGVIHAHARARWTGRTLRVEIEGWVNPDLPAREADALGRQVADSLSRQLPEAGSFTWTTRAALA